MLAGSQSSAECSYTHRAPSTVCKDHGADVLHPYDA